MWKFGNNMLGCWVMLEVEPYSRAHHAIVGAAWLHLFFPLSRSSWTEVEEERHIDFPGRRTNAAVGGRTNALVFSLSNWLNSNMVITMPYIGSHTHATRSH
jgi:hypothetical protein